MDNLKRVSQYRNGSILKLQYEYINYSKLERDLIKLFTKKFKLRKDIGYEYFEGNLFEMKCDICKIIQDEEIAYMETHPAEKSIPSQEPVKIDKQPKCDKCNREFSHNWCLIRHAKTCKGYITKNQCKDCRTVFNNRKALYRHSKICDVQNKQPENKINIQPYHYNRL